MTSDLTITNATVGPRRDPVEINRALLMRGGQEPVEYVAGAVISDGGRVFVHRRAATRRLFPGCWDVVGGHVERGETVRECLEREVREETGWELGEVVSLLGMWDWQDGDVAKRDIDFLVTVDGDIPPRLEAGKHTDSRWVTEADLDLLRENRHADDQFIIDLVQLALAAVREGSQEGRM